VANTKIVSKVTKEEFTDLTASKEIRVSPHAFFRLSDPQREQFTKQTLINFFQHHQPVFIGKQANENYSTFYGYQQHYLRIVFAVKEHYIEIITFLCIKRIPVLEHD